MAEQVKAPTATMETDQGTIELEFWPDVAPKTVENFLTLARKGFYNGLIFHRVIPNFMIQGGCPQGTGTGGPGHKVKAEFNARKHKRGVISMARSADPDSAGSQFFLMHKDSPHLDGAYTGFGQITSGIEVVDKIVALPTGANDRPKNPPKILKVTVNE
jgi:peptidyl-prolyl cis-trans isomerase B (cyclophilin B)